MSVNVTLPRSVWVDPDSDTVATIANAEPYAAVEGLTVSAVAVVVF